MPIRFPTPRGPARWGQLILGLLGFGVAVPLMIRSGLGLGPWDAFHVGIHNLTGITVGTASIVVGLVIVLASYPLGVRPGSGTVANMVLIGVFIDLVLPRIQDASGWWVGLGYYAVGIGLAGLSTGMYIGAGLGSGPRDGLMIGLSSLRGWPVRRVRTFIELSALAAGWAMGGAVGIGTVLFAVAIGPAVQVGLQLFGVIEPSVAAAPGHPPRPARAARRRAA
ncbi:MAG TPA: hypothetical protein VMN39_13035 [Longimicrobiaceae bacterium]|nr:hypothetical protein [Longimicrobiaceae bacterium]